MNTKNQPRLPEILDRLKSEQDTRGIEHLDFEILCDSRAEQCVEIGSHRADWLVLFSCGHSRHWCNVRFIRYRSELVQFPDGPAWCVDCSNPEVGKIYILVTAWWPLRLGS